MFLFLGESFCINSQDVVVVPTEPLIYHPVAIDQYHIHGPLVSEKSQRKLLAEHWEGLEHREEQGGQDSAKNDDFESGLQEGCLGSLRTDAFTTIQKILLIILIKINCLA